MEETETFKVKKVSLDTSKMIAQARMAAGLKQKELAQRMNLKATSIQQYENGTAVPTGKMLQKFEGALGLAFGTLTGKKRKGKKKKK